MRNSLKKLDELQVEIDRFIDFLQDIQRMIEALDHGKETVLMKNLTLEQRLELGSDLEMKKVRRLIPGLNIF